MNFSTIKYTDISSWRYLKLTPTTATANKNELCNMWNIVWFLNIKTINEILTAADKV